MNINERKQNLVNQINGIFDEKMLILLEDTLHVYDLDKNTDITSGLSEKQLLQLTNTLNEPDEQNTVTESEFNNLFANKILPIL